MQRMTNGWKKQAFVQEFYFELVFLKQYINMFESMEISKNIYEGVVELSYKKTTRKEAIHTHPIRMVRGIYDL